MRKPHQKTKEPVVQLSMRVWAMRTTHKDECGVQLFLHKFPIFLILPLVMFVESGKNVLLLWHRAFLSTRGVSI